MIRVIYPGGGTPMSPLCVLGKKKPGEWPRGHDRSDTVTTSELSQIITLSKEVIWLFMRHFMRMMHGKNPKKLTKVWRRQKRHEGIAATGEF